MFIVNHESLDKTKLFFCKSPNLMKFLTEHKGLNYISSKQEDDSWKYVWFFVKGEELNSCLAEWKLNRDTGNLLFPK